MPKGTNLPAIGGFNQTVILDLVRRAPEGLSRVEIAEKTGLSPQTITNVTRRLLDDGLIVETGKQISGPGKPRVILELLPRSRFAIGVHLDPTVVTFVILDLHGRIVADRRVNTPRADDPSAVVVAIAAEIDGLIDGAKIDRGRILGIGIAAPGPIDSARGIVVDPPLLEGWMDVPLRDALSAASGLPVVLEKDVNAAVVAELWTAVDRPRTDFAFFYLGTGIGVGLALGGEVLRGATGNAGEGGTLVVASEDLPEGRRSNMIGHLATPQFLVEQASQLGVLEAPTDERDLTAIDEAFTRLVALADEGDAGAVSVLDRAADYVGSVLVTIVNLLDVDEVVFGGPAWARVAERFRPIVHRRLHESVDRRSHHAVELADSAVGEDVAAVGAASLVLDTALAPRPSGMLIGA